MQKPPFLKHGDTVMIVSPSGKTEKSVINKATAWFEHWGLKVITGKYCLEGWYNFAGPDEQRLADLQEALDNEKVKAIFCARGGYGMVRIIDRINFAGFLKSPKWIVGFSDVTFLHAYVGNVLNTCSVHGPMPLKFSEYPSIDESLDCLKNLLFGKPMSYTISGEEMNIEGESTGQLVGGNLSVLCNMNGSRSDFDPYEKILFLEDIGEYLYHIDRMLWALERSHDLSTLKGLVVGQFSNVQDNQIPFGRDVDGIVLEHFEKFGIPVCFGFPAGHEQINFPLVMNHHVKMKVHKTESVLEFDW